MFSEQHVPNPLVSSIILNAYLCGYDVVGGQGDGAQVANVGRGQAHEVPLVVRRLKVEAAVLRVEGEPVQEEVAGELGTGMEKEKILKVLYIFVVETSALRSG